MAIDWKKRAKKFEDEALTAHANVVKIAFCLEREKALHRRTLLEKQALRINLNRAIITLYGAAENLRGHGQRASADAIGMFTDGINGPRSDTDGEQPAQGIAKDEQV